MLKSVVFLVFVCLTLNSILAYGGEEGKRVFRDPISGKETVFNQRIVDGWTIDTLPGGRMIIVSQKGKAQVFVTDWSDTGVQVDVRDGEAKRLVTVKGVDRPHHREIEYGTGAFLSTDANYDGQPDTVIDYRQGSARVWYGGAWCPLLGGRAEKYIVVNGHRIVMKYKDGRFVPE